MDNKYIYTEDNFLSQLEESAYEMGYYRMKFFTRDGHLSDENTGELSDFYYYPSGGTLRDSKFNIVFYTPKFDTYRGFVPPHARKAE